MFCKNCGAQIDDAATFCPHCGAAQTPATQAPRPAPVQQTDPNTIAIVGFVLAFFIPFVGLICSIIGLKNSKTAGGKNHGFALAGVIISALEIAAAVLSIVFIIAFGILATA